MSQTTDPKSKIKTTSAVPQLDEPPLRYPAAAAMLGMPLQTLRYLVSEGRGPRSIKIGRSRYFPPAYLREYMAAHEEPGEAVQQQNVA